MSPSSVCTERAQAPHVNCQHHAPWFSSSRCRKQGAPRFRRRCAPGSLQTLATARLANAAAVGSRADNAAALPSRADAKAAPLVTPAHTAPLPALPQVPPVPQDAEVIGTVIASVPPPSKTKGSPAPAKAKAKGNLDYSKFDAIEDSDDERLVVKPQSTALPLGLPQEAVSKDDYVKVWQKLLETKHLPYTPPPDLETMWGFYKYGSTDERALLDQACFFLAKLPLNLTSDDWKSKTYSLTRKMETECRDDEARMWVVLHMCRFPDDGDAYYNQGVLLVKMADRAKFGGAQSVRLPSLRDAESSVVPTEQYCSLFTRAAASHYRRCLKLDPKHRAAHINLIGCLERNEPKGWYDEVHEVAASAVRNGLWHDRWQRPPHFVPSLAARPWREPAKFALCRALHEHYPTIRAEYDAYMAKLLGRKDWDDSDTTPGLGDVGSRAGALHDGGLTKSGRWREVPLFTNGALQGQYAAEFPETVRVLQTHCADAVGLALCLGGDIIFSVLSPGTRLRPHCGPTNSRLTCHLGIIVPRSASQGCRLRVAAEPPRGWEEGRCVVFDDSFEHEVIYDEPGPREPYPGDRVVLLANFWHPAFEFKNDPDWRVKSDQAMAAIDIESLPQTALTTVTPVPAA